MSDHLTREEPQEQGRSRLIEALDPRGSVVKGMAYVGMAFLTGLGAVTHYEIEHGKQASMEVTDHAAEVFKQETDQALRDMQQRANETGQQWIVTFKQENTDKITGEIKRVGDNTGTIAEVIAPSTTQAPVPPSAQPGR